jgi:hypothetical protein
MSSIVLATLNKHLPAVHAFHGGYLMFCLPAHLPACRYAVGVYDKRTNTLQLAKPAGGSVSCPLHEHMPVHEAGLGFELNAR